jgi:hypothetical protein
MFRKVLAAMAAFAVLAVLAVGPADAARLITGSQIKNGSVTGADVKNGSIAGTDIRSGTVTGTDVKNGSLTSADFRGSVKGDAGPAGAAGPQGPQGASGPQGPQGPAGPTAVNALNRVVGPLVTVDASGFGESAAVCPGGQTVVGGGYSSAAADGEVFGNDTYGASDRWIVLLDNFDSPDTATVQAFAYCAPSGAAISPVARAKRESTAGAAAVAAAVEAQRRTH